MENIYKILRDIGVRLASAYESPLLLEEIAKAAQDLANAQEAYALVLDANGRLQISYSSTPTPPSIEMLQAALIVNDSTAVCVNANGDICIHLAEDYIIYLIGSDYLPEQAEILELFREQTALQFQGILQHEKTAADLRHSKNQYRHLLASLQEGIWAIDTDANTTFVNEQMATMLGYTVKEMMGKPLFAFMDEEGMQITNENIDRRKNGIEEQHPFKFIDKQGNPVYTLMETSPIEENGRYTGAIAGVMDITAREYALKELRYSEKRFRDLVETTSDWIWEIGINGLYTYNSKVVTDLLGYTPEELVGTTPFDLMLPEEAERVRKFFIDITPKKLPYTGFRNVLMHKNGTFVQFVFAGAPIIGTNDELLGYRGIGRDITRSVKQEEERNRSKEKTELLLSVLNGINLAPTFHAALEIAIRLICKHTSWIYGEAWISASKWEGLYCDAHYADKKDQIQLEAFTILSEQTTYAYGEGLVGRVWHSQKTVRYENIHLLPKDGFSRTNAASKADLKTLLAVPTVANKTTMTVMVFYASTSPEEDGQEMELITAVAFQLGLVLQQKQTEESLRKLSRAVEQSATSIFITDLDGKIEFINPAFTQISGYSYSEIVGQTPSILRSHQTPQAVHHDLWSNLQQGKTWEGRLLNKRKDGSLVWLQSIMSLIKDQNGNVTHYFCIQSDISQQVESEAALRASIAQNRVLIETIPDLMFIMDRDGVYIQSYDSDIDYLMPPKEFLNRNVADIMPPDITRQTMAAIKTTLLTGETSQFNYTLFLRDKNITGHYEARFSRATADSVLTLIRDVTSEWQATERLRESRRKFAKAQALAHLGSWELTLASNKIVWSDEMYRIYGHEPQSFGVTLEKVYTMVHPEDREMLSKTTEKTIASGQPYEHRYRLQRPSGEIRYMHGRGELYINEVGESVRLAGASLDITEQVLSLQKIEQAKEESQQIAEKLNKAQELAHLGSWEWTIASGKLIWSDETYRIFGYAPQSFEITYDKFLEMVYPEDVVRLKKAVSQTLNTKEPYHIEHRLQLSSGEIRFVLERGELHTDENDNPIRMVGAILDITDQTLATENLEKAKKEAQESEQKLARAQAIAHLGSWEWDAHSQTLLWSDEAYRMAGYEPQSFTVTQAKFLSMLHPDDVEVEKAAVRESLLNNKPYLVQYRLKRPSGEIRHIEERGEPFYNEGAPYLAGTTLDITEQVIARQKLKKATKKAEYLQQEAERANQAKSLFLTNMSHELRTPLNGILGYTQLFKQDDDLSEQQLHGINVIHRSGEHLLFMINDMLDLAKIEAGKVTISIDECHLSKMLISLVDMVSQSAAQKGIDFSHHLATGLPQKVMTDGVRLRQILLNLLSNAVKFTNNGAVLLEVLPIETAVFPTTSPPNTNPSSIKIRFRIEDTGTGIAPELLETIFAPFEQVGATKHNTEGTGLGLAISQRLTTLLGGTLKVSSRLNKGSVFWFDLDLQIAQDSERVAENTNFAIMTSSGVRGDKKVRLLIADDAESNRFVLKTYLSRISGFEIMEAHDGKDAVTKAANFKPHVILMDLKMPVMDGKEAARQIRLLPSFEKGIIIAVSANAHANIREDALNAGFDDFAVKPLKLTQLFEKIKRLLGEEWEWEYNEKEARLDKTEIAVIEPLPEEETAVLLDLAQTGDIKNLRSKLDVFRQNLDPQHHATIDKLAQLTREYRVKQMRELLEKL